MLNEPCIPGIHPTWLWWRVLATHWGLFDWLIFGGGVLHVGSWEILVYSFLVMTVWSRY